MMGVLGWFWCEHQSEGKPNGKLMTARPINLNTRFGTWTGGDVGEVVEMTMSIVIQSQMIRRKEVWLAYIMTA